MTNSNILLVGATGTIGFSLAKQLSKKGIRCRCLVRDEAAAKPLSDLGMDLVVADLSIPSSLMSTLSGIEKVFMCTPLDPSQVELQGNLVMASKGAKVKQLVKISALGSDSRSTNPFLKWHGLTEQKISDLQIPYTFLRPHYFMQNTLMFQASMKSADSIFTPMQDAKFSLVDADDVAAVACGVLTSAGHENKIYEITGPQALSFKDIADVFSKALGRPIEHLTIPYDLLENSMREQNTPAWLIEGVIKLYQFFDTGDAAFVRPTTVEVAKKNPASFAQFVEQYKDFFKA